MMKSLWIVLSTLAIANLIALGAFAGWLKASDRLSAARMEKVREIFKQTVAAELSQQEAVVAEAAAKVKQAEEDAKAALPPVTADQRLAIIREYQERTRQEKQRVQRETENLIDTLTAKQAQFDSEQAAFRAEKEAFEKQRAEIAALEGDAQFQKSLKIYQSLKPEEAASMLAELMTLGKTTEVIAYLNAMKSSAATKIVAEFQKTDPKLAADLLERLRLHGLAVADP
jgi:flagellar motility protein MotE (MotC chaperone)